MDDTCSDSAGGRSRLASRALVACCAAVTLTATGCSTAAAPTGQPANSAGQPVNPADPYAAQFEAAIAASKSDFVTQVLKDHQITDQEFQESEDGLMKCLTDSALNPILQSDGTYPVVKYVVLPADVADSDAARTCYTQWSGDPDGDTIESLYKSLRQNPGNANWWDLVAACLVRQKLVPEGTTGKDLEQVIDKIGSHVKDGVTTPPQDPNATLPGGLAFDDPKTTPCQTSPLHPEAVASK